MSSATIDDFDRMAEAEFARLAHGRREVELEVAPDQREAMVIAHRRMVADMDEEIREGIDWSAEHRSNWALYAELRMNGWQFDRLPIRRQARLG